MLTINTIISSNQMLHDEDRPNILINPTNVKYVATINAADNSSAPNVLLSRAEALMPAATMAAPIKIDPMAFQRFLTSTAMTANRYMAAQHNIMTLE